MKQSTSLMLSVATILVLLVLAGCSTPGEYSDLPWTEPWDSSPQLPGMSPGY